MKKEWLERCLPSILIIRPHANLLIQSLDNRFEVLRFNFGSVEKMGEKYYSTLKVKSLPKTDTYALMQECVMKVRSFLTF